MKPSADSMGLYLLLDLTLIPILYRVFILTVYKYGI